MSSITCTGKCAFIPLYSDEPTTSTEILVEDLSNASSYPDENQLLALSKCMAETRSRSVTGMACTSCGKINER